MEVIRERPGAVELSTAGDIHPTVLSRWKRTALDNIAWTCDGMDSLTMAGSRPVSRERVHRGGITTTHANGAIDAFDRIATLVKNFDVGRTLDKEAIRHVIDKTVDVVLFMAGRRVALVFHDPMLKWARMSGA